MALGLHLVNKDHVCLKKMVIREEILGIWVKIYILLYNDNGIFCR